MEVGNAVLPLTPPVTEELYSFKLTLTDGDSAAGVALRAESANLWHRRVGHIHGRYLDVLRRVPGNGVEFTGELQSCDICTLGKSFQKPHQKHGKNDVMQPFQLVTNDVLRPVALGRVKFISKTINQFTKWSGGFSLEAESNVVDSLQLYNQHTVIPSGYPLGRVKRDRGGEFSVNAFRQYGREVGVRLEFAATNTPQQIGANERVGRALASMVLCLLCLLYTSPSPRD